MKDRISSGRLLAFVGFTVISLFPVCLVAQNPPAPTNTSGAAVSAAPGQNSPLRLSYGVPDIMNLSRAHVSDDTIVAFIEGSQTVYNLSAPEIVYLREQGVSDRVITTMLNQRGKAMEAAAQVAARGQAASPAPSPSYPDAGNVQPSTVYVVPSSPTAVAYDYYPYYPYYPYYAGSYWYPYPAVSFSFGFGGHGGFHGGGFHGGGFHGGGFHGGGFYRGRR